VTSSEHVLSQGGGLSGEELGRLLARARERQTLTRIDLEECVRSTAITPELVEDLRRLLAVDGIALDASVDDPPISFLREIEAEVDAAEALAYENELDAAALIADAKAEVDNGTGVSPAPAINGSPADPLTPVPDLDEDDVPPDAAARRRARMRSTSPKDALRMGGETQTGASADPVRMYLKEIGRVSLLTAQQEVDLAKRIEAGSFAEERLAELNAAGEIASLDPGERRKLKRTADDGADAKAALTQANLRLVVSIARRYVGRGMLILDLIQEGNLGLMRAVEKFDYTKGFKFSTYATWWIRQAITPARVREIMRISQDPLSLDSPVGEEADSNLADFIEDQQAEAPAEMAARKMLGDAVVEALDQLNDREKAVVRLRFGLDDGQARTLEEVGREFGVTRERIRQIESKTLAKLRHPHRSQKLRDYLDGE